MFLRPSTIGCSAKIELPRPNRAGPEAIGRAFLFGGNHPPEDIGLPPYTESDARGVRAAIAARRAEPPAPSIAPEAAEQATETIARAGEKLGAYLGGLADSAARKFAEEFGKNAARATLGLGVWTILTAKLLAAAQAAHHWLEAIRLFG